MTQTTSKKRTQTGVVVSNKMTKTVLVRVESIKTHKKYLKRYRVAKKFAAHCEIPDIQVGDKVIMEETRPMSKSKFWKVVKKV